MDWTGAIIAIVSLIVLALLTTSEIGWKIVKSPYHAYQHITTHFWVPKCDVFTMDNITSSLAIHVCPPPLCNQSQGVSHDGRERRCWENTLGVMRPPGWEPTQRIRKPNSLSPTRDYLCTNAETIMGFVLCSTQAASTFVVYDFNEYSREVTVNNNTYSYKQMIHVEFSRLDARVAVVHLEGNVHNNPGLTKGDIAGLSRGYPPWYREKIELPHRGSHLQTAQHPITSLADIPRSGWIVALGLSNPGAIPTACHDSAWITDQSRSPLYRALEITRDRLMPSFSTDPDVKSVVTSLERMWEKKTNSGADVHFTRLNFQPLSKMHAEHAMKLYNEAPNIQLEAEDIEMLNILDVRLAILHAVYKGADILMDALKNSGGMGRVFALERFISDRPQHIYIRDCFQEETDAGTIYPGH